MRVQKCSSITTASTPAPKTFNYEEIQKAEGVYAVLDSKGVPAPERFVVLKQGTITAVLWVSGTGTNVQPSAAVISVWKFIRIEDAVVCFEIKEPRV